MTSKGKMRLGAFFNPTGHHVASWRHPRAQADAGINFAHYLEITRTAERGKFDMVFLADNLGVRAAHMEALSRSAQYIADHASIRARHPHQPHRPRGHRLDELQRAVPRGAQVRFPRSP
jgi:N-acetyl-S-(2-succino)cysteine monooxygenase